MCKSKAAIQSSSKRCRDEDSPGAISPPGNNQEDLLLSIDNRLSSFDARLSLLELLHKEFRALWESLELRRKSSRPPVGRLVVTC